MFSPGTLTQICYSNPKLEDKILIENKLFINKSFSSLPLLIFKSGSPSAMIFIIIKLSVSSTTNKMFKPACRTDS